MLKLKSFKQIIFFYFSPSISCLEGEYQLPGGEKRISAVQSENIGCPGLEREYQLSRVRISVARGWKENISCLEVEYQLSGAGKRISAV